jgi:hypothetical protein
MRRKKLRSICWRHLKKNAWCVRGDCPEDCDASCQPTVVLCSVLNVGYNLRLAQQPTRPRYDAHPRNPFEHNKNLTVDRTHTHTFGYITKYASSLYSVRADSLCSEFPREDGDTAGAIFAHKWCPDVGHFHNRLTALLEMR